MAKRKKQTKRQIPIRLNILFFVVFLLFAALIFQLGAVQILHGESYQKEIDRTVKDTTKEAVPRGEIFDRNHNVVVGNKALYSITYTPAKGTEATERQKVAKKLSKLITMYNKDNKKEKLDSISSRDKKEYWYLEHEEEAEKLLSKEEAAKMDPSKQYNEILNRIDKKKANDLTDDDRNIILIRKEMDKARTLTPQIVKNKDVTPKEYASVAERLSELPGVNASTDWNRTYPYKDTFKSLLGSVSSQSEGIPSDKQSYFLARGYDRNDRVGRSGLEEQYESKLRGRKEQVEYTTNSNGNIVGSHVTVPGERGKDVVMSIDMDFQKKVDKIVQEELKKTIKAHPYENRFTDEAMAVVMDPKTGELLAVSGQHYDRKTKKFDNEAYKALYDQQEPGSAVKGATILSGYQSGAIKPNQVFEDKPMKIAGTPKKSSYRNLGTVNDLSALRLSSNVYMFNVALRMGGEYHYQYNKPVHFNTDVFTEIRNYFGEFGLGVSTGIDYPYEALGVKGTDPQAGNLLDFSIGQYDTYTTMQLAQYAATIANDGKRVQPHFLKETRLPSSSDKELGPVFNSFTTNVLNQIEMKPDYIKRVQEGFRQVYQETGGTAYTEFANKDYNPAGKTGTAQKMIKDENGKIVEKENNSLIGYAPFDNPEVAMAIIVPKTGVDKGDHVNNKIGERIMDTYFDMKKESKDETGENKIN